MHFYSVHRTFRNFYYCQMIIAILILFLSQQCSIASQENQKENSTEVEDDDKKRHNDNVNNNATSPVDIDIVVEEENDDENHSLTENFATKTFFHISDNPDDVKFLLFQDAKNVSLSKELILNDSDSIKHSGFDPYEKCVFIIHGFWSNSTAGMAVVVKKGYLEAGLPYNIIVVDWGKLSSPDPKDEILYPFVYPIVVHRSIPIVYKRVAEFIQFLVDNKFASLDRIHVVGHSLGAHISGNAGHVIAKNPANNGHRLARISGLDPAGPLFQVIRIQRRLKKKDASFVDIYHTAAVTLGNIQRQQGHADFFPNGGHHQPGCLDFEQPIFFEANFGSCSHSFVAKMYAASITKDFHACRCDPFFLDLIAGSACPGNCTVSVLAGERCPPTASGQFYFKTSEDPFEEEKAKPLHRE